MKDTTVIEKELNSLLTELERLKSVNELISANTDNTGKIIKEVGAFVNAIKSFNDSYQTDYESNKSRMEELITTFLTTFNHIDKKVENHSKKIDKTLDTISKSSKSLIKEQHTILTKEVNLFTKEISVLNRSIKTNVDQFTYSTAKKISERESTLSTQLNELLEKSDLINKKNNEIYKLISVVEQKIEGLEGLVKSANSKATSTLNEYFESLNKKAEEYNSNIETRLAKGLKEIDAAQEKVSNQILVDLKENKKEISITKLLAVGNLVVIVVLFIMLIFR